MPSFTVAMWDEFQGDEAGSDLGVRCDTPREAREAAEYAWKESLEGGLLPPSPVMWNGPLGTARWSYMHGDFTVYFWVSEVP